MSINHPSFKYLKTRSNESEWLKVGRCGEDRGFPLQIDFELNTTCNLKCDKCIQSVAPPKPQVLDYNTVVNVVDEGVRHDPPLKFVKLQYRGEPLIYPDFLCLVDYIKSQGLYVHFNTNGQLLTKDVVDWLIEVKLDKIICSIDSTRKRHYEKHHRGASWDKLINNLGYLQAKKMLSGVKYPLLRVQTVVQNFNKVEIVSKEYVRFWENIAEEIAVERYFDFFDNKEISTVIPNWHCEQLFQRLIILASGDVIPCCSGIDYCKNKIYSVGNVKKKSIEEIWNSRYLKKMRKQHLKGNSHYFEMCRRCRIRKLVLEAKEDD